MASTAWTATREELVRELAKARTEREIATARLEATRLAAAEARERHNETARLSKRRRRASQRETHLMGQAEAIAQAHTTPPDPNAAQHRRDLIAALKEKP